MCQCCQVQKVRSPGHLKNSCVGYGERGSWHLVADGVDKEEPSIVDFNITLSLMWSNFCLSWFVFSLQPFFLFGCACQLGQKKSVAAVMQTSEGSSIFCSPCSSLVLSSRLNAVTFSYAVFLVCSCLEIFYTNFLLCQGSFSTSWLLNKYPVILCCYCKSEL